MIPASENSTNFALPNMQSNMSPLCSPQSRRQSCSNNGSSSASTPGDTSMTSPVEHNSFSSTTSHTGTSNGSAIGCGRMGCTGGILVMFPSSPSTTANCTIRANVALSSNANGLTSPNSSGSVSQVIAQRFCNCPSPMNAEPETHTSRSGSGSSSQGAPQWGATESPHCTMMEVDESDTPRPSARHPSIHCPAMGPTEEEAQHQQPQLYIDTQIANLDFHGPHSPPTVVPMYKRRQSALCAMPGGAPQTNGPVSSHEHFLSIRNRANSNPHSQSLYAKSPVNGTFSSSFDGSINGSPLTIMNSPVSPSTNRVQRPLANFRRYHANSISNSNSIHSGVEPGLSYPTQYRSSQNFVNLNRSAMMHNMHNNFRSMDSASVNAMNHLANGVPTHASVDLSRTALLIRESGFMNPSAMDSPMSCSSQNSSMPEINKIIFESQEAVYSLFMKAHKCYDLIPTSSKLVVFDTELPVSKAFFALVYNGVRAAPLWDSKAQDFVGMLTITDFIQILHKYYAKDSVGEGMKQLEEHKISTWRNVFDTDGQTKKFITIDPSESLHRAVQILCEHKIHRLPVLETSTGNILYILTHKRLIKFLFLYINDLPKPAYMDRTPKELGIGSWGDISTICMNTPLIDALKIFLEKRVSALPLLDSEGRVVDIYAKFDAINLAADKTYNNLDVTVYEALKQRSDWFEGVRTCKEKDSLMTVIDIIVKAEVHRLIVTDDAQRVTGIISLSDILKHLVLNPPLPQSQSENEKLLLNSAVDQQILMDEQPSNQ